MKSTEGHKITELKLLRSFTTWSYTIVSDSLLSCPYYPYLADQCTVLMFPSNLSAASLANDNDASLVADGLIMIIDVCKLLVSFLRGWHDRQVSVHKYYYFWSTFQPSILPHYQGTALNCHLCFTWDGRDRGADESGYHTRTTSFVLWSHSGFYHPPAYT